jgi:hypothetical protein
MIDDLDKIYDMPPFIHEAAELLTSIHAAGIQPTGDLTSIELVEKIAVLLDMARCNRHRRTDAGLAAGLLDELHKGRFIAWCPASRRASQRLVAQAIAAG